MVGTTSSLPIRLGIVNDFQVIVDGIEAMFADQGLRVVVIQTVTGRNRIVDLDPDLDLVLFDPFASGDDLATAVASLSEAGHTDVVVYSWRRSPDAITRALDLGVLGYLSKTLSSGELVSALERIHLGERLVVPSPPSPRAPADGDWPGRAAAGLTPRESEILCLIAQGFTNLEITELAYLGRESLKTHIRSAYAKIGVTRRPQAILWCVKHGLTSDDSR